jgi:hypothetical protein
VTSSSKYTVEVASCSVFILVVSSTASFSMTTMLLGVQSDETFLLSCNVGAKDGRVNGLDGALSDVQAPGSPDLGEASSALVSDSGSTNWLSVAHGVSVALG